VPARPILRYGAPLLHRSADPVVTIDASTAKAIDDLIDTMHNAPGIGLAAPQIGLDHRILAVDLSVGQQPEDLIVLINPTFLSQEGLQLDEEGCLSVPGFRATVARPARVTIGGLDRHGMPQSIAADGLLARALHHEMDHLDGILFVDRLRHMKRWLIVRRIEAMRAQGEW
jgi:peptide deformylase